MNKPLLSDLKVGMHIWLPRLRVGRAENWGYKSIHKSEWVRGTITSIKGNIIGVCEAQWDYIYEIDYQKDQYGKDWVFCDSRRS